MEFGLSSNPDKSILKLDPRTKLCLLTAISLIMVGGKTVGVEYILRIICAAIPFVLLLTVRHIRSAAIYAMLLGLSVFCEGSVIPNISGAPNLILMIICGIISRFVPGYMMGWYTVRSTSVSEFITAMDKMHIPYFITIPFSVMFRYFPTLGEEYDPENYDISIDHVSFSYGDNEVLKDISLEIPENTMTAFVGSSGAGKTTLAMLIARFWDVGKGSISIGGRDVRDYTLESLMLHISVVFQHVYLFADTIENNIKFGMKNASHEAVVAAAKKACCHDFIMSLPDGYSTVIGEGGATLSGGEKQRISIARAILKDAPIIILDEATANVDPENEDKLISAFNALTENKTVIMIAHRLKTIRNADQIVVLDGGTISSGTHEELLGNNEKYSSFIKLREEAARWKMQSA